MTVNCYKLKVWNLQCKFSTLAEKYMNNMLLGITCPEQLDYLKTFRRSLKLLNRYDTRDVVDKTTDYNVVSYATIISILETLEKKY